MEPATPTELDAIIADLLADPGPPLMVTFTDGRTVEAGIRRPPKDSIQRVRDRRRQLEALMRERGWVQDERSMIWRPAR
jgi:hypothetical protein